MRKRLWSPDEDEKLQKYVSQHGFGNWSEVAKKTGLQRCGKSCRLRWINYLRPDLKRGKFTAEEKHIIVNLQKVFGNSWSKIAAHLPGRTDSDIKNFWHSHFRKKRPHIPSQAIPSHNPTISKGHGHDSAFLSAPFMSGRLPLNPIHPSSLLQPLLHAPPPPPPPPSSSLSLPFCSFSAIPSSQGMSNTPLVNIDHHQQSLSGAMSHAMPCLEDDVQLNQDKQHHQHHQQQHQQQQQANDYQGFNVESCDLLGILKCNATWFNGEKLAREKSFVPHDGDDIDNDNNNNNMDININNICGDCSASSTSCSTGDSAQQHAFYQDVIGPPEGLELVVWSCVNRPTPNEQGASGDHAVLHMDDCPNEEHYTPFLELQ